MKRDGQLHRTGDFTCFVAAALYMGGLVALAVRLHAVQIENVAALTYDGARQSVRRVRTPGERGRIVAADGTVLAANAPTRSILLAAEFFQRRTWDATASNILAAVERASVFVGRPSGLAREDVQRHIKRNLAMPLVAWKDVTDDELARFCENQLELPGFMCAETSERVYPQGTLAAHILGYVGRDRVQASDGDEKMNFIGMEMRGRAGLEERYDAFLRGVPGEKKVVVDARGFACREQTVAESQKGPDLVLALDVAMQREAERQLAGCKGACVALDPRDGAVLVMASSPSFDPNAFVPVLPASLWQSVSRDPSKPLLNRAAQGMYAPGSTFKPVTAYAGMSAGISPHERFDCLGAYRLGRMRIRCSHAWGHASGSLDLADALKESCNPYFCDMGVRAGTNALISAARALGLGERTGVDLPAEARGVVPDAEWKREHWQERWYPGDVPQMAIGQGMLLVTPLQMARLAAAIGSGEFIVPHFKAGERTPRRALPYPDWQTAAVRDGLYRVCNMRGGTGRRASAGLPVEIAGKTGTAEVGAGATRRKNTWFVCYAPAGNPTVALAIIVEDGETGGSTAAPRAREILRARFGGAELPAPPAPAVKEGGADGGQTA